MKAQHDTVVNKTHKRDARKVFFFFGFKRKDENDAAGETDPRERKLASVDDSILWRGGDPKKRNYVFFQSQLRQMVFVAAYLAAGRC